MLSAVTRFAAIFAWLLSAVSRHKYLMNKNKILCALVERLVSYRRNCCLLCSQKGNSPQGQRHLSKRKFNRNHGPVRGWEEYIAQRALWLQAEGREWRRVC